MTGSVRRYVEPDREPFIELHRNIFDSDMSSELFSWKYQQTPKAQNPPVVVAERDDSIVGAVGSFLVPFKINQQRVLASRPVDLMIDEDHRSHKLFINLIEELRELYTDNVVFEFGTGVRETRKAWERFGGWEYDYIDKYIRIHRPEKLLGQDVNPAISHIFNFIGSIYKNMWRIRNNMSRLKTSRHEVHKESGYVQRAFNKTNIEDEYVVSIQRDADYWEWRADDPRIKMSTYWVGSADNPKASVLTTTRSTERSDCRIALQDHNNKNKEPLLSIYRKILEDHTESATIQYTNNKINDEFISNIGLNHMNIIEKMNYKGVVNKSIGLLNKKIEVEEFSRKPVGCLWLDSNIDEHKPQEWEYSDLTSD